MRHETVNHMIADQIIEAFSDTLADANLAAAHDVPEHLTLDGPMIEAHYQACRTITLLLDGKRFDAERFRSAFEDALIDAKRRIIYIGTHYDRADSPVSNDRITEATETWEARLRDAAVEVPEQYRAAARIIAQRVTGTPA